MPVGGRDVVRGMAKARHEANDAREGAAAERLVEARFQWDAEVENARRLSRRTSLLITIEAALLGVGAARLGSAPADAFQRVLVGLAALAVFVGLSFLLRPRRRVRGRPQASQWLQDRLDSGSTAGSTSILRVRILALERTRNAALDLGRRNVTKQRDIDRAQLVLLRATSLFTLLGLTWLFGGAGRLDALRERSIGSMIQRIEDKAEFNEPVNEFEHMSDEELRALSDAERERIEADWVERFQAWSRRFQREALEEIKAVERTRGLFGISNSA